MKNKINRAIDGCRYSQSYNKSYMPTFLIRISVLVLVMFGIGTALSPAAYGQDCTAVSVRVSGNAKPGCPGSFLIDNNSSTSVSFATGSTAGRAEITLDGRSLIRGVSISCTLDAASTISIEYDRDGVWQPFSGARYSGISGSNMFFDLSFERIVTDKIALQLTGTDISRASVSEVKISGRSGQSLQQKITPVSITATDNTCYFTPEENTIDGNVFTDWRTRALSSYDGDLGRVRDYIKGLKTHPWIPAPSPYEASLVFDLGGTYSLSNINIYFAPDSRGNAMIQIERNGTWETVRNLNERQPEGWTSIPVSQGSNTTSRARFIVDGTGPYLGGIGEIEFWGTGAYGGDRYIPIGLRGPIELSAPLDFVFSIPEKKDYDLELEIAGDCTAPPNLSLNANTLGSPTRIRVGASTVFRTKITATMLFSDDNFLTIETTNPVSTFISARLRQRAADGEVSFQGAGYNDDLIATAAGGSLPTEFDLGKSVTLDHVEIYSTANISVSLRIFDSTGNWISLGEKGRTDNLIVFDGREFATSRIKVTCNDPQSMTEIKLFGSPTKDKSPDIKILTPQDGINFSVSEVSSGLLIGSIDNTDAAVKVNGVTAEKYNHYFWVKLSQLSLSSGDAYTVTASATDSSGRTATSAITILVGLPQLLTIDQPDSVIYTDQSSVTMSGSVASTAYKVEINNAQVPLSGKLFSKSIALHHGLNLIAIRAIRSSNGKQMAIAYRKVFLYSGDIKLTIDSPNPSVYIGTATIVVHGTVEGLPPVQVLVNGIAAQVFGFQYVSSPLTLAEGSNPIVVTAKDKRGYQIQKQISVMRDTQAPVLAGIAPANGFVSTKADVVVSGNIYDVSPSWVKVNGIQATITNGTFSATLPLTDGQKTIEIKAGDAAGNQAVTQTIPIIVDTTPPAPFTVTATPASWTNNPRPVITFATTDMVSGIDHYELAIDGGSFTTAASPYTLPAQTDGEHAVVVKAFDRGGLFTSAGTKVYIDTTPPNPPLAFRAISETNAITLKWVKPNDDIVNYRITRVPAFEGNSVIVTEDSYKDATITMSAYIYFIVAIDKAGNESLKAQTDIAITGITIKSYEPTKGSFAEYEGTTIAVQPGSLPDNVKKIVVTEITSPEMTERAIYPIISPIYDYSVLMDVNGEEKFIPHISFEQEFIGSIKYDETKLPEGFPEENLGVYYFDPIWSRWFKLPNTAVDKNKNLIFFKSNHFSEFSVQPTFIDDMSPQELKDTGYSPFKTEIQHQAVSISPQGGSVHAETTELVLPGRNNFNFSLKRIYDSSLARMDSMSTMISASIGLNLFDIAGNLKEIGDLISQMGLTATTDVIESFKKYFMNNGDYAYSMGQGWRLNIPYFRGTNGGVIVRTPGGGFYPIDEMQKLEPECIWESSGVYRELTMENHTQEDFKLKLKQARLNLDIVSLFTSGPTLEKAMIQFKALALASEIEIQDLQVATEHIMDGLSALGKIIPDWLTLEAELTMSDGTVYKMDALGRTTEIIDPTGINTIQIKYAEDNGNGDRLRIVKIIDSMGHIVNFSYQDMVTESFTPRIESITLANDPYERKTEYTIDTGTQTLIKARQTGKTIRPDGSSSSLLRDFDYTYQNNYLLSYGGSAKINILSIVGDIITSCFGLGGLVSQVTGWDNLTLSGNIKFESVESLNKASGPGIGITEITNEVLPLGFVSGDWADYIFGIPISYQFNFDVANIIAATKVVQIGETTTNTTSYGYNYVYAGKQQYVNTHTTVNDNRTIVSYEYGYDTFETNRLFDWSDYVKYYLQNRFLTNPAYTIRSYNTATTLSDMNGKLIEKNSYSWNNGKTKIIGQKKERYSNNYIETDYNFDNWGNVTYSKNYSESGGRINKSETWAYYHNTSSSPSGDAAWIPCPYAPPSFTRNIHNLPIGKVTKNTISDTESTLAYNFFKYNSLGQRIAESAWTGSGWAETTYEYNDPYGRITKKTAPNGHVTDIVYNDDYTAGLYTVTTRENGMQNVLADDGTTTAAAIESVTAYEKISGFKKIETNPRGFTTNYTYDPLGRIIGIEKPTDSGAKPLTQIEYNDIQIKSKVTGPKGEVVTYDYDNLGRLVSIDKENRALRISADMKNDDADVGILETKHIVTGIGYDGWGDITSITDPNQKTTSYEYDAMGRNIVVIYPSDTSIRPKKTMSFDYGTNTLAVLDERGNVTYEYYDMKDRLIQRTQYAGITAINTYAYYDGLGNTIKTIDGNGNVAEKIYDTRNLLVEEHLPQDTFCEQGIAEGQPYIPIVKHTYDDSGFKTNDIIKINGDDYTIAYTPDGLGRTIATSQTYTDYSKTGSPHISIDQSVYYDKNGNKKKVTDANNHSTTYTYTARDKVKQETDPAGGTTSYAYDADDNKTSMTDPRGNTGTYSGDFTIDYTYDDLKRLVKGELPKTVDIANKPIVTLEYDPRGNLTKRTEPSGLTTTYTYTPRNKVKTETVTGVRASGTTVSYTTTHVYDDANNETKTIDNSGHTTQKYYDDLNRLFFVRYPENNTEGYEYDANGNRITVIDGKGKRTETTYTAYNKPKLTKDPLGHTRKNEYDSRGNITRFTDEKQNAYTYLYDELSRLAQETDPLEFKRIYGYDPAGNKIYSKDPNGTELTYTYTPNNLLTKIIKGATEISAYSYDEAGDVKSITQLGAATTKNTDSTGAYTPDPYSLVHRKTTTAGGKIYSLDYQYDNMNRNTALTYPTGTTIRYNYNNLGQLESVPGYINEPPVYDSDGLVSSIKAANGVSASYGYDTNNRLTQLDYTEPTQTLKSYTFTYDQNNNITWKNTSSYAYDELDRLSSAALNGRFGIDVKKKQQIVGKAQDDFAGQEQLDFTIADVDLKLDYASMSIGINLQTEYEVNRIEIDPQSTGHRVSSRNLEVYTAQTNYKGGYTKQTDWVLNTRDDNTMEILFRNPVKAAYIKVHCAFDDRDSEEQPVDKSTITNAKQELVKVFYMIDFRTETYAYNEKGDRTTSSVTLEDTETKSYVYYDHSDRLKSDGTFGYVWDNNGNLTAKGTMYQDNGSTLIFDTNNGEYWSFTYDIFNRLVKVSKSTAGTAGAQTVAEYTYDAENLRIRKSSVKNGDTWYVYGLNGEVLYEETAKDTTSYVYVNGRHFAMVETDTTTNTSATYFWSLDHLGSTVMVTDTAGKVVWQNEATPFGEWSGEVGVMHLKGKFTGKDQDEETGLTYFNARWYMPELGRFTSCDPMRDGINWYVYVRNNPLRFTDLTGLHYEEGIGWEADPDPAPIATPTPQNEAPTPDPAQAQKNYLYTYSEDNSYWRNLALGQAVHDNVIQVDSDGNIIFDANGRPVPVHEGDTVNFVFVQNQAQFITAVQNSYNQHGAVSLTVTSHMWQEGINFNMALSQSPDPATRQSVQFFSNEIGQLGNVQFESVHLKGCESAGTPTFSTQNFAQTFSTTYNTVVTGSTTQSFSGSANDEHVVHDFQGQAVHNPENNGIVRILIPIGNGVWNVYSGGQLIGTTGN